ncbi:hypothetical protein ACMAUO_08900 [Gluconacetobacter sp. Hr-1-5]|uniref:hypothetical protein n=1 Tax=Gluconacetobacter sp. Hr-1-5 TaxID=3395370 RepID=UPI003B51EABD
MDALGQDGQQTHGGEFGHPDREGSAGQRQQCKTGRVIGFRQNGFFPFFGVRIRLPASVAGLFNRRGRDDDTGMMIGI